MFSEDPVLKDIQRSCLGILKKTAFLCDEMGLTYYLCGGTLLGAVREHGFIPWDDDIDLMMPRKDYDKLVEFAEIFIERGLQLEHFSLCDDKREIRTHHVQIIDPEIDMIREWTISPERIHPWIDIFPLDGMPDNVLLRNLHYYHYRFWHLCMQISFFDQNVNIIRENRPLYQKWIIWFLMKSRIGSNWDTLKILEKAEKIATRYRYDESDIVCSFHGLHKRKEMIPASWFSEKSLYPFEDGNFAGPGQYDLFLKNYYGTSYMAPDDNKNYKHEFTVIKEKNEDI